MLSAIAHEEVGENRAGSWTGWGDWERGRGGPL